MRFLQKQGSLAKVRPDMKIVFMDDLPKPAARLKASSRLLKQLVKLAEEPQGINFSMRAAVIFWCNAVGIFFSF